MSSSTAGERQPLLSDVQPTPSTSRAGSSVSIQHISRIIAALRAGFLPSTPQLAKLIRAAQNSPLLAVEHTISSPTYGTGRIGTGKLTREGENVREAVQQTLQAFLELIEQKNSDNQWQNFIVACRHSELDFDAPSVTLETPSAKAKTQAKESVWSIFTVFLTTPEIQSSLYEIVQSLLANFDDIVAEHGDAGVIASKIAHDLAKQALPEANLEKTWTGPAANSAETFSQSRDEILDRIKKILVQMQSDPNYQIAMHKILTLTRNYLRTLTENATPHASLETPNQIESPLKLLVPLIEAFTGGEGSLDLLIALIKDLERHAKTESRFKTFLLSLDNLLEHILLDVGYIGSSAAHRHLEQMHARASELTADNPQLRRDLGKFFTEFQAALKQIIHDPILGNFIARLGQLSLAVEGWFVTAGRMTAGAQPFWGDLFEFIIPRIGKFLAQVPLPRIEYKSDSLNLALDFPTFISTSFIPDRIKFDAHSEITILPATDTRETSRDYTANSRLAIEGLRMDIRDIGYYMRYRGSCFSFTETGLLDLQLGTRAKEGLAAILDFTTLEKEEQNSEHELFKLAGSEILIKDFQFEISESCHPILIWLLKPILRREIKKAIQESIQQEIETRFNTLSNLGWRLRSSKNQTGSGKLSWIFAFYQVFVQGFGVEEDPEEFPAVHVSRKGVAIDLEQGIVGMGAEGIILPEGEAQTPIPRINVVQAVKSSANSGLQKGKNVTQTVLETAGEFGEAVQQFPQQVDAAKAESARKGISDWKNPAFDWE